MHGSIGGQLKHFAKVRTIFSETTLGDRSLECAEKFTAQVRQFDAVLRTLRSSNARLHRRQIEFDDLRVINVALLRNSPETLDLIVVFVSTAMLFAAARRA